MVSDGWLEPRENQKTEPGLVDLIYITTIHTHTHTYTIHTMPTTNLVPEAIQELLDTEHTYVTRLAVVYEVQHHHHHHHHCHHHHHHVGVQITCRTGTL